MAAVASIPVHLSAKEYNSDIHNLRDEIRRNGSRITIREITVFYGDAVKLHINLGLEPNHHFPKIPSSVYTVAFGNGYGTWHFGDTTIRDLPGVPFCLGGDAPISADYRSLGYPAELPVISGQNLKTAVSTVAKYQDGALGQGDRKQLLTGIARLIIAVNEAVRFAMVERGVYGTLLDKKGEKTYLPTSVLIRNWDTHHIGLYELDRIQEGAAKVR